MAQTPLGLSGGFWPTSLPLFHASRVCSVFMATPTEMMRVRLWYRRRRPLWAYLPEAHTGQLMPLAHPAKPSPEWLVRAVETSRTAFADTQVSALAGQILFTFLPFAPRK